MLNTIKKICLLLFLTSVFACNNNEDERELPLTETNPVQPDSTLSITDAAYFWEAKDIHGKIEMQKIRPIPTDSLNYNAVIGLFNSNYPDIKLIPSGLSHDTLSIKIENSAYLTQRMGSTGAETYIKELTYNLTELKDIHFIDLHFKRGDHAEPGIYTRADFVN